MYNAVSLRCSVFCTPIKYDKTFVAALADVLPNFVPVIIRDNIVLPVPPTWQLNSPDDSETVAFVGDKIDFVKKVNKEINEADIREFILRCQTVFEKIMRASRQSCSRLAFAPSVLVAEDKVVPKELFEKVFAVREYDGSNLATSNFSQVYRVDKTIGSQVVTINHVANFRIEPDVVLYEGRNQMRERYLGDFDINTFANPSYRFEIGDMKSFFELSLSLFKSFYSLYLGG